MKAWLLDRLGGLDQLRLADDAPDPTPAAGEAVLAVSFAALNPADRYLSEGQYPAKPPVPHILGRDGFGEVVAVGRGVNDLRVGDRRTILRGETGVSRSGTLAQRVVVGVQELVETPKGWTAEQA